MLIDQLKSLIEIDTRISTHLEELTKLYEQRAVIIEPQTKEQLSLDVDVKSSTGTPNKSDTTVKAIVSSPSQRYILNRAHNYTARYEQRTTRGNY